MKKEPLGAGGSDTSITRATCSRCPDINRGQQLSETVPGISPSVCLLSAGQYSGIGISRSIDVNSLTLMLQTVADSGIGGPGATKKDSYRISHKPGVAMQKVA